MSYLNQPEKVYVSSDDKTNDGDHSGNFSINLNDAIQDAQKVSILSAEYPSSFYNIQSTDTLHFDEVYIDTSGVEKKRINFSISGLAGDNYTASELKDALNLKLTYSTNGTILTGVDSNYKTYAASSDYTINGHVIPNTNTSRDTLGNDLLYVKLKCRNGIC